MTSPASSLELRTPNLRWMLMGCLATLCLFGLLWFVVSQLVNLDQAATQSRVVMISSLGWMVCTLAWWKMKPPSSRLHAVFGVLLCALVVALAGTAFSFAGQLVQGTLLDHRVLRVFSILSGALLIVQLILAVPSAVVLQQVVLRRVRPQAPHLPG